MNCLFGIAIRYTERQISHSGATVLRHWLTGLLLTLFVALFSPVVLAAAPPLLGFVDIAYLIDNSPQSLQARERLEQEFMPRQQELAELREERLRSEAQLNEMNEEEKEPLQRSERNLRAMERRLQRMEQAFREDLNIKRNTELKKVRDHVLESVTIFARQEGFDLILTDGVLFASTSMDVTQRVLELLRKQP